MNEYIKTLKQYVTDNPPNYVDGDAHAYHKPGMSFSNIVGVTTVLLGRAGLSPFPSR